MAPVAVDSPFRRSILMRNHINANFMTNDDEAERRSRRSELSLEANNASSVEDNENLKLCLKLYADNKITKDNAWAVSVIDTFSKMIEKHHKSLQNFQVAGSTLEASSKVYGLRVDSVHTDVMRMCSELTRQSAKNPVDNRNDDSVGDSSNADASLAQNEGGLSPYKPKKKVKKHRRHISTITKNKDTINGKLETNPFTDPFFAKLNSIVGDINSSNRLMQSIIPTTDAILKLRMTFPCWDSKNSNDPGIDDTLDLDDEQMPVLSVPNATAVTQLCLHPSLAGYVLSDIPAEEDEEDEMERAREAAEAAAEAAERQQQLNNSQIAVQFDINAEVEAIPTSEAFIIDYGDVHDDPFDEMTEDDHMAINACRGLKRQAVVIEDMRPVNCTSSNLEYSYRPMDMINQFWAGPSHWKFRRLRSKGLSLSQKQTTDDGGGGIMEDEFLQKNTRKKPRKKPSLLCEKVTLEDFEEDLDHLFLELNSKKPLKNISMVNKYRKWNKNSEKLKLPTDLKLEHDRYDKYYFAPGLRVHADNGHINLSQSIKDDQCEIDETDTDTDFGGQDDVPFNDAASNATSSCAELPHCSTQANATIDHIPTEFQGAPERVAKIIIPYAKTAKVVDMKQLKFCCWRLITEKSQPSIDDVVVAGDGYGSQIPGAQPEGVMFHDVMQQLPKILSKNMADSISISLAFYSILHLANEKNLELEQDSDLKDFRIVQHK